MNNNTVCAHRFCLWTWSWFLVVVVAVCRPSKAEASVMITNPSSISSSENGILETVITLEAATHTIIGGGNSDNIEITSRLLNGTFPGPTIRLRPGDTFQVEFRNNLELDHGRPYVHNEYSAPDESNLHFHGLHVSGELPSDDVTYIVKPGESYTYQTTLPQNHMPGTHWIHPHRHGSTAGQVGGGAVSALIVDDPPNTLPPQVENATEILFIAQLININKLDRIADQSDDSLFYITGANIDKFVVVNGQRNPTIPIVPGEWFRLRIVWANWEEGELDLTIPNCEMQLLAKDGIYIRDFPRTIQSAPIVAGGRADIMVRCLESSTSYDVIGIMGILATIQTSDGPVISSSDLESWTPTYPNYLNDLRSTSASEGCSCKTKLDDEAVNNIPFDYNQILHTSYLGAVVERVVDAERHPYHQHVYPYQLVSGFGDDNGQRSGYDQLGDWHDTVTGKGVIRYNPTEFTGKVMIHCHFLIHEDQGSMAIETIDDGSGTCTCTAAGGIGVGAIIGIVVGCTLVVSLVGYCIYRRRRSNNNDDVVLKENAQKASSEKESDEEGAAAVAGEGQ